MSAADGFIISKDYSCLPGFFCPNVTKSNNASLPRIYQPSAQCVAQRFEGKTCPPQGPYEPIVCESGYYCPNSRTQLMCPSGSFCPTGSISPIPCNDLSICPEGSVTAVNLAPSVAFLAVDAILLAIYLHARRKSRRKAAVEMESGDKGVELELEATTLMMDDEGDGDAEVLVEDFRKGMNGQTVKVDFAFEDLSFTLKSGKTILQGVTGEILSGRMTAVMGPSGAGKTTFLNVLMGKVTRTGGRLFINGEEGEMSDFKKIVGYVPQDDIMLRELTVRENIEYSARVRLPATWSNKEVGEYVDRILMALNLSHVQHTPIGDETTRGISGGQRKRVNIGMELAAVPVVLFLDEPTSGLDSSAALSVARILKEVTKLDMTVVAVVHQPRKEIFDTFDDLLLIGPGGRTAYHGPVLEVQAHFEQMGFAFDPAANPADILMDILSNKGKLNATAKAKRVTLDAIFKKMNREATKPLAGKTSYQTTSPDVLHALPPRDERSSTEVDSPTSLSQDDSTAGSAHTITFREELSDICDTRGARWDTQVFLAHNRYLRQQYRMIGTLALETAVSVLAGALMGLAAQGSDGELFTGVYVQPYAILSPSPVMWAVPLYSLLIGLAIALASGPAGVRVFGDERTVFFREAAAGHSRPAYYVGKSVAAVYRIVLTSLHFSGVYYLIALPVTDFSVFYGVVLMSYWGVYGLGATVSMIVKKGNAPLLAAVVALFHATFCGFGPTMNTVGDWNVTFIWDLSFNRWGAEALYSQAVTLYKVYDERAAVTAFGYALRQENLDLILMLALGLAQRVIAFVLMMLLDRDKQK